MGEAKRRQKSDPTYGRVPKGGVSSSSIGTRPDGYPKIARNERGLVVSPPIEISGRSLFARSYNLDPQELRFSLLFWEKLVWPSSRAIYFESGIEEQYLETAGVLSRPSITIWGDGAQGIAQGQIKAFQDLDRADPGAWALAQGQNSLLLKDPVFQENRGLLIDLHRAIPVPDKEVPLEEILEFRKRRYAELLCLRSTIDGFYDGVLKSGDQAHDLRRRVGEIEAACTDLVKAARDWKQAVRLSDLKAVYKSESVVTGWLLGQCFEMGTLGLLVGAGVSAFRIVRDFGMAGVLERKSPYRYAAQFHTEVFNR